MTTYQIADIEQAINHWRAHSQDKTTIVLGGEARALADIYGMMIYQHVSQVDRSALTEAQRAALDAAGIKGRHEGDSSYTPQPVEVSFLDAL